MDFFTIAKTVSLSKLFAILHFTKKTKADFFKPFLFQPSKLINEASFLASKQTFAGSKNFFLYFPPAMPFSVLPLFKEYIGSMDEMT